ncbi:MAG: carbohydrate-binding family 9-like protein [Bacteroidales bacterium]
MGNLNKRSVYEVTRLCGLMPIDGIWDKPAWDIVRPLELTSFMGVIPVFRPEVRAKMMYDEENLFVIFRVDDRFVRCVTTKPNGPVWEDSCVEFFFSPDNDFPEKYFNLEINCGGTPLMHYNIVPRKEFIEVSYDDILKIQIAHSLPDLTDPEIVEPVIWTVEYKIPLSILRKYSPVTKPQPGVEWKANFYKCAEKNSNPHFITWAVVQNNIPDFHLPQFFGTLGFL